MNDEQKKMLSLLQNMDEGEGVRSCDIVRAPFGWHGGKSKSLKHILQHLPYRKTYCEVFGGSGAVLLARQTSPLEVFNDRYAGVTCFYRCIRDLDKTRALVARLDLTCHSREEFEWCKGSWEECGDEVERAARWYYMVQNSFTKQGRNWARSTRSLGTIGRSFKNNLDSFGQVHERMKNVQVDNMDWRQCMKDYDSPYTVFYLDPPYLGVNHGAYKHDMLYKDHVDLLERIQQTEGFVAISGYGNELYDSYKWDHKYEWEAFVASTGMAQTQSNGQIGIDQVRGRATECLWIKEAC